MPEKHPLPIEQEEEVQSGFKSPLLPVVVLGVTLSLMTWVYFEIRDLPAERLEVEAQQIQDPPTIVEKIQMMLQPELLLVSLLTVVVGVALAYLWQRYQDREK